MADTKISDLSVETTPPAATDHYVAAQTDTANTAVPASMVTLAHAAGADSDTTMAIGTLYVTDMSAWATADRTYTLPTTAAVGSRIGIMVTAGDASHELIITAAASDTLNGVAGGTEWSRLFITNEVVIMRCVTANSAWIVEHDGRVPCYGGATRDAAQTITTGTNTKILLDNEVIDIGDIVDVASNDRIDIRRTGVYIVYFSTSQTLITDQKRVVAKVWKNGSGEADTPTFWVSLASGSSTQGAGAVVILSLSAGDYLELYTWHSLGGNSDTHTSVVPTITARESL